jgi:hypothetical protein
MEDGNPLLQGDDLPSGVSKSRYSLDLFKDEVAHLGLFDYNAGL